MEEIEVGEYIRTHSKIRKVTNPNFYMQQYIECGEDIIWRNDILKHSKNIIDLIEVGDYVNGCQVIKINKKEITIISKYGHQIYEVNKIKEGIYNIQSIVTKEQFASMEYKVGE